MRPSPMSQPGPSETKAVESQKRHNTPNTTGLSKYMRAPALLNRRGFWGKKFRKSPRMKPKTVHVFEAAYRASRDLPFGCAPHRGSPAQEGDDIARLIHQAGREFRQVNLPRGRPPVPVPKERDNVAEGIAMRSDQLDDCFRRRPWLEKEFHRPNDVLEQDDLQRPRVRHNRDQRKSGQASHECACSVCRSTDHDGRPQNDPVEVSLQKIQITRQFRL